jgi:hypothetical protein
MKKFYLLIAILQFLLIGSLQAQTTEKELFSDLKYVSGLYCPYYYVPSTPTPAPAGYTPFYISHYGRHGSRWLLSTNCYTTPEKILGEALEAGKLTPLGKSLYERIKVAAADAVDRYGDLSSLGAKEHRGIAERMFKSFPEVFSTKNGKKCLINSRATQVPRCILSMAAFDERLKELNPELEIIKDATKKYNYLNNDAQINRDTVKAVVTSFIKRHFNPGRFISSVINDKAYAEGKIKDQTELAYLIFKAAINMPNLDHLKISMMDVFTNEEIFAFWQASNLEMYSVVGPSALNGKAALKSASLLLKDILDCADNAIKNNNISADLRFGHDSYIIPLLALMDIKNMNVTEPDPDKVYKAWSDFKASPMGTNLQLIFFKNNTNDDVIVKLLHLEREVEIPVKTDIAPFYHWKDVKSYYEKKISQ